MSVKSVFTLNDACMTIGIINTGKGTEKEDRERIEDALQGKAAENHVGLANIVKRLRLIYGKEVGIRVDMDDPGETAVYIDIPQEIGAGRENE